MQNQHREIQGYRELNEFEISLMNGVRLSKLFNRLTRWKKQINGG
jgi:hypothetical protein